MSDETIEQAITHIPETVTAWELSSRNRKKRFVCELSWLVGEHEEACVGHADTPAGAVQAACRTYAEGKSFTGDAIDSSLEDFIHDGDTVVLHEKIRGDDPILKKVNTAGNDIIEIFRAHQIDRSLAMNVLISVLVKGIFQIERDGGSAVEAIAVVNESIVKNLKGYREANR